MQVSFVLRGALAAALGLTLAACAVPGGNRAAASAPTDGTYSFGLWGDMPYKKAGDEPKLPAVLNSINASDIAFSLYDGDIKDGSSPCTDQVYTDALKMFNTLKKPVVYVPGDNEWTDCHRSNNGGMDSLERLAHIRKVMFADTHSLGQTTLPLLHQGKPGEPYVENTRFSYGDVVFVGINMPGSNNNLVLDANSCTKKSARQAAQCDAANAEHLARDTANVAWMRESFAQAQAQSARGLVVVVQGEPGFDVPESEAFDESTQLGVSGYQNFMGQLVKQTEAFAGQVLFVHGDVHNFKVDKPLYKPNSLLPNFTRVETFGSPSLHWVKVTVDPASANVFRIEPVLVTQR